MDMENEGTSKHDRDGNSWKEIERLRDEGWIDEYETPDGIWHPGSKSVERQILNRFLLSFDDTDNPINEEQILHRLAPSTEWMKHTVEWACENLTDREWDVLVYADMMHIKDRTVAQMFGISERWVRGLREQYKAKLPKPGSY